MRIEFLFMIVWAVAWTGIAIVAYLPVLRWIEKGKALVFREDRESWRD